MKLIALTLLIGAVAISAAQAQTTDTADVTDSATGSERARLANQRIQADMEMRAREEQRRIEEEQSRLRAEEAAARSSVVSPPRAPAAIGATGGQDISRTLQQIRMLGELKDAGYVTEEEFQQIKQRILDDQL